MKVLHVNGAKTWRGGEQQTAYLLEELAQLGIENVVACRQHSALAEYCQKAHISFTPLPFRGGYDAATQRGLKTLLRQGDIDLAHLHTSHAHTQTVLAHFFGRLSTPLILSRRIDFALRDSWLTRWKYNYSGIARYLAVSDVIRRILEGYVKRPERVLTVHSGINPQRFATPPPHRWLRDTYGIDKRSPLIGNTSALAPHKDYYTFLDTAAELTRQGLQAHYVIMGEGELEGALKDYAKALNLEDSVTFTGFLTNLGEVLPELDVFLMTSEEEGLGTSVQDAFAARVPVVATRAGGIPEMVRHEDTGLLAEVKRPLELAREVMRVLGDQDFADGLRERAYRRLIEQFTKDITARKTLQVYQEVLASRV